MSRFWRSRDTNSSSNTFKLELFKGQKTLEPKERQWEKWDLKLGGRALYIKDNNTPCSIGGTNHMVWGHPIIICQVDTPTDKGIDYGGCIQICYRRCGWKPKHGIRFRQTIAVADSPTLTANGRFVCHPMVLLESNCNVPVASGESSHGPLPNKVCRLW